ncbi:MAG: SAM-dependent methyltransferase [Alphaproteobacteria bacterium]|jgi:NADH dehydrogenase [ubiquinone] 1 alpha subcomplex assembly factor 7|nr:MAG: SAM-dependent methyltransferase [Alphaproteobacteria bacterium]
MTDLRTRIVEAIRANGPMPVSLYMLMCLHDPRDGYYATRPGFNQDFTTAPETSQVFGELAGLWAAHEWMKLGAPPKFWLIELGPGRGTMMADLLRAAHSVKGFAEAAQIALIEASPALRDQQKHLLSRYTIQHFDELDSVPPGPSIIVANEFLDCLAVRQYARDGNGWRERQVGLDKDGNLAIGIGPPADLPEDVIPVGDHVEVAPALGTMISSVATRFRQHPGRALFLDYGPDDRSPDETLRAYKAGEQINPLAEPGASDLTADVDFPRMRRISESEGLAVHGPIQQRYFLTRLGAKERAEQLIAANPRRAEEIARAVDKLVSPEQMGARFKAIALTPYGADTPPGF